jgi:hypothetical protein
MEETRSASRIMVWKSVVKWPLGRLRMSWLYNIKINPVKIGCEDRRWMELVQDCAQWFSGVEPSSYHKRVTFVSVVKKAFCVPCLSTPEPLC